MATVADNQQGPLAGGAAGTVTAAAEDVHPPLLAPPHTSLTGDEEATIGPLLARANLFRLRGQWDAAIAACTEALRHAPRSASAHSLLGDIYEAQGRHDEAVPWFAMAVDLAPGSEIDREKLHRAQALQRERHVTQERMAAAAAPPVPVLAATIPPRPPAEKTIEWFDRMFPPGRADSIARLIFTVCGAMALLLIASAVFLYLGLHKGGDASRSDALTLSSPTPSLGMATTQPIVMRPSTMDLASGKTVAAGGSTASSSPAAVASPPVSGSAASETAAASGADSAAIRSLIAPQLPAGSEVTSAAVGAAGSGLADAVEIALPLVPAESADRTRDRAVRAAAAAIRAFAAQNTRRRGSETGRDSDIVQVTVSLTDPGHTARMPVFVAQGVPAGLRDVDVATAPNQELLASFRALQWTGSYAPAMAAPGTENVTPSAAATSPAASPSAASSTLSGATAPAPAANSGAH